MKVGDYMRIKSNIFIILCLFFIFINIFNIKSFATYEKVIDIADSSSVKIDGETIHMDRFKPAQITDGTAQTMVDLVNSVLGIITAVGIILSVVLIAIIGFNYVIGSANEKAINKEQMLYFLVGAVLLTTGTQIVKLIYKALK